MSTAVTTRTQFKKSLPMHPTCCCVIFHCKHLDFLALIMGIYSILEEKKTTFWYNGLSSFTN